MEPLDICVRLAEREKWKLEVEQLREHPDRPDRYRHQVTHIDVEVISADEDGVLIQWTPQWTDLLSDVPAPEMDPEIFRGLADYSLEIALDARGRYLGVSNEVALLEVLEKVSAAIMAHLKPRPENEAVIRRFVAPRAMLGKLARDPGMYFGFGGKQFDLAHTEEEVCNQPNPLADEPYQIRLKTAAERDGTRAIVRVQQESPLDVLLKVVLNSEIPPETEGLELVDLTEAVIDLERGLPETLRFTRRSNSRRFPESEFVEIRSA